MRSKTRLRNRDRQASIEKQSMNSRENIHAKKKKEKKKKKLQPCVSYPIRRKDLRLTSTARMIQCSSTRCYNLRRTLEASITTANNLTVSKGSKKMKSHLCSHSNDRFAEFI